MGKNIIFYIIRFIKLGSYNPVPTTYDTFWKTFNVFSEKKKKKEKGPPSKLFGLEARFPDPKKTKIKNKLNVPGPGNYDMIAQWAGKERAKSKGEDKKNWMLKISKGFSRSIYC